jgi:membrane carboxypeptidase/penicillin-binding protein
MRIPLRRCFGGSWGVDFKRVPIPRLFAKRQLASIKPLIYAAALEKELMPAAFLKYAGLQHGES